MLSVSVKDSHERETYALSFSIIYTEHEARLLNGLLLMGNRKPEEGQVIDEALGVLRCLVLAKENASTIADVLHSDDEFHAQSQLVGMLEGMDRLVAGG